MAMTITSLRGRAAPRSGRSTGTEVGGERIEVRGCDLWTIGDDGLIVKKDSFWKLREP